MNLLVTVTAGQYRTMPVLGDLYEVLKGSPDTRRLANIINRLVHGSAKTLLMGRPDEEPPHYLVLADQLEQIQAMELPNVCGYCTVAPNGAVQYYQKE